MDLLQPFGCNRHKIILFVKKSEKRHVSLRHIYN